jgi:hypothetical protein
MSFRAKLGQGITLTNIEGKHVLFSIRTGETFGLNETAAALLQSLLASDFDAAVEECAKRYDVAVDELRADLKGLVDELSEQKLVSIVK